MRLLLRGIGALLFVFGVLCFAVWQSPSLAEKVDSGEHCGGSKGVASDRECTVDEIQYAAKLTGFTMVIGGGALWWVFGPRGMTALALSRQAEGVPVAWTPPAQPPAAPSPDDRRAKLEALLASGALTPEEQASVRAKLDALSRSA